MSNTTIIEALRNLYGNVGSFWIDQLQDATQHAALIDITARSMINIPVHKPVADIMQENRVKKNFVVPFRYKDSIALRSEWQRTLVEQFSGAGGVNVTLVYNDPQLIAKLRMWGIIDQGQEHLLADETKQVLVFPNTREPEATIVKATVQQIQPLYALRWNEQNNGIPLEIRAGGKSLMLGSDFAVQPGILLLRQNPVNLFPDMKIKVRSSMLSDAVWKLWSGLTGHSQYTDYRPIARYRLANQGAGSFVRAAAAYAGFPMLEDDDELLHVSPLSSVRPFVTYTYKKAGMIEVPAHPEPDEPGHYPKFWVPGDLLRVTFPGGPRSLYEGTFDASRPLPLSGLTSAPNIDDLTLPGQGNLTAEAVSGTAPNFHLRFPVNGPGYQVQKFFDAWHEWEDRSGVYFSQAVQSHNSSLTFSAIGDTAQIPVHFLYLKYLLDSRGFIFSILKPYANALAADRLRYFVRDEKPVYAIPVFLQHLDQPSAAQLNRKVGVRGF